MRFSGIGLAAFVTQQLRRVRSLQSSSSSTRRLSSTALSSDSFASSFHAPVMWRECIDALLSANTTRTAITEEGANRSIPRIFVDGTLGGGGHTAALLQTAAQRKEPIVVFGCDVDSQALQAASDRLNGDPLTSSSNDSLFVPVHANFCTLTRQVLADHLQQHQTTTTTDSSSSATPFANIQQHILDSGIDGILMDLGVSSHQINTAERGFAFALDGPLDMRMAQNSKSTLTAADVCNEMDVFELRRILTKYGDEPRAKSIAESILQHRPLERTQDLVAAVAAVTPAFVRNGRRMGRTASLARVFQSLRIVVNREDLVLESALTTMAPNLLQRPGGRLVVLSYHSLEDRATKRAMRDGVLSKHEANLNNKQRDVYGNYKGPPKPFRPVGKPRKATAEEVELNSRSRSATLRVAERL